MSKMFHRIKKSELPSNVSLSEHIMKQCKEILTVNHIGFTYYIGITPKIQKMFDKFSQDFVEDIIRDIIHCVRLQIRDTVGHEVERQLSGQIADGFNRLFEKALHTEIEKRFDLQDKLLKE